jgi:hypothetical protein
VLGNEPTLKGKNFGSNCRKIENHNQAINLMMEVVISRVSVTGHTAIVLKDYTFNQENLL